MGNCLLSMHESMNFHIKETIGEVFCEAFVTGQNFIQKLACVLDLPR